jgi:hypothetical protein
MERTEAVVLDQFGEPWGLVDTIENNDTEIGVFCEKTTDGCPVNIKYRKISRARKNFEHFERYISEPVYFSEYKFNGQTFFEYEEQ